MPEHSAPVVALRAARRADGSVLLRLSRAAGLLVDDLPAAPARRLLQLGQTSSLELTGIARRRDTSAETAAAMTRLARAAERAAPTTRLLDQVLVTGSGPLPAHLSTLLRSYARSVVPPQDASGALAADDVPDLVVSTTSEALDLDWCAAWASRRATVLPLVARGDRVIIGPLLPPDGMPCARCIELQRLDRDPQRASLLVAPDPALDDPDQLNLEPALATMAAGVVGELVRCLGQGTPLPRATSWSVRLPYPDVRLHGWRTHPRCTCPLAHRRRAET